MLSKEYVILVDERDKQIGKEEKLKAHELGLLHRAFSVFLFRKVGDEIQLLMQQRANHKYHCPGLWANTCCSHPREGEDISDAGKRRLHEEMGIAIDQLFEVGSFQYKVEFENGLTENEIDHVLIGRFDLDKVNLNKDEVENIQWISLQELEKEFDRNPTTVTPWFRLAFNVIPKEAIDTLLK